MKPIEKARELAHCDTCITCNDSNCLIPSKNCILKIDLSIAMQMHEWTKNELLFILDNSYELRKKVCRSELSFADCTELVKRLKKIVEEEL